MLRNRIHRLLGGQHELKLPVCSDLFGKKVLGFLEKLELAEPAGMLLTQQLALHNELVARIRQDEAALKDLMSQSPELTHVCSLPEKGVRREWHCFKPVFGEKDGGRSADLVD